MGYVLISFKMASDNLKSVCAIGIVSLKGSDVTDVYYAHIKPPITDFDNKNIECQGINPRDVENASDFATLWESEIKKRLEGNVIISQNIKFDIDVLSTLISHYNVSKKNIKYGIVDISTRPYRLINGINEGDEWEIELGENCDQVAIMKCHTL